MSKLTVTVNSAGGSAGEIKNKVYERKKVEDANFGIKYNGTYYLKRSGITYYEPKTTATTSSGSGGIGIANPGIGLVVVAPEICVGSNCLVIYKLPQNSLDEYGIDSNTISYYNAANTSEADFAAVYNISNDTWYKFNQDTSHFDIPFIEDDEDYELLEISGLEYIGNGEALSSMIVNADGSEFKPKPYKIVNTTVEQHNQDLKNWYYEGYLNHDKITHLFAPDTSNYVLLNVPKWDIIREEVWEIIDLAPAFYEDSNVSIKAGVGISPYIPGVEPQTVYIVQVLLNPTHYYYITDKYNSWIEVNGENQTEIVSAPNITLDASNFSDNTLKNAVYGPQIYLLKHKFAEIDNIINKEVNGIVLKNKIYDYIQEGSSELENGETYSFKEDCSDFFNMGFRFGDIYSTMGEVLLSAKGGETRGGEMVYEPEAEEVRFITYDVEGIEPRGGTKAPAMSVGTGYIMVGTTSGLYYFYADGNSWSGGAGLKGVAEGTYLPPNLVYNSEYVQNEEALKAILNLGGTKAQTLGEKFDEPIKNWTYDMSGVEHRLNYDMSVINSTEYLAMAETEGILPTNNSSSRETLLYEDTEKQFVLQYYVYKNNGNYYPRLTYGTYDGSDKQYNYDADVKVWYDENHNTINSQNDLPEIDYDVNYVLVSNTKLVTSLIADIPLKKTLEQKVEELPEWTYSKTDVFKDIPDWSALEGREMYEYVIYADSSDYPALGFYITENYVKELIYYPDANTTYTIINENAIIDGVSFTANTWYCIDANTNQIVSTGVKPDMFNVNSEFIANEEWFNAVIGKENKTLREKFQTCLVLERLHNITIAENDLEVNNNSYASNPYLYVWKAQIQDEAFKNALKVEVVFDIAQITEENICPVQDIDNENGILTLYVKQKNGNIVLNRIDIFKNND